MGGLGGLIGGERLDAFATNKQSSMQTHRPHLGQLVTAALRALLTMGTPNPGPARLNSARLAPMGPDSWERLAE